MIREANLSDFDAIAAVDKQVSSMHIDARPDLLKKNYFTLDFFEKYLENESIKIFVFEENGNILGHCIVDVYEDKDDFMFHDAKILFILSMCVDEKARGKHIGRHLFDRAKAYAKEVGANRLDLIVWDFNKNAREFYEHLGMSARATFMELSIE